MKTIDLFNDRKQNLTQQVKGQAVLPEKYCPNCGMKHQVKSELVELPGFPKGCKHVLFWINCPDEDGDKKFGKYCAPVAKDVVFMEYFHFNKNDEL